MRRHKKLSVRPSEADISEMEIICHRGVSNVFLENSLSAFRALATHSGTWVEFDVHATLDDVLVVYHDFDLARLTITKDDRLIRETLFSDIQKLTLINGEKIPTLSEVVSVIPRSRTVNVELKGEGTGSRVYSLLQDAIDDSDYLKRNIVYSSFLRKELDDAKASVPDGRFAVLVRESNFDWKKRVSEIDPWSVHFGVDDVTNEQVSYVQELGKKVFIFTVNTKEQFIEMAKLGVDGVFTDFSEMRQIVQETVKMDTL
jgi:glycerophosphoryl diester phosphodiesterase